MQKRYFISTAQNALKETMPPIAKGRAVDINDNDAGDRNHDELDNKAKPYNNVFDAILYPNRSLSNQGFMVVMGIVISVNLLLGLSFTLMGAWPVLAFGGLDIFVVWLAFKISYRQGRLQERIRVTQNAITISRTLPSGHEMRWQLHPLWTDIDFTPLKAGPLIGEHHFGDHAIDHEGQVALHSKGKTLILGSFLSPKERVSFGEALKDAVYRARSVSF